MIPEYITTDLALSKIPTREELLEIYDDQKRVKRLLLYLAYELEKAVRYDKGYILKSFWQLSNFQLEDEDKPIIEEFFTSKGYVVLIDETKSRVVIMIDPEAQIIEDIEEETVEETDEEDNTNNDYEDTDGDNEILDEDDPWRFR